MAKYHGNSKTGYANAGNSSHGYGANAGTYRLLGISAYSGSRQMGIGYKSFKYLQHVPSYGKMSYASRGEPYSSGRMSGYSKIIAAIREAQNKNRLLYLPKMKMTYNPKVFRRGEDDLEGRVKKYDLLKRIPDDFFIMN